MPAPRFESILLPVPVSGGFVDFVTQQLDACGPIAVKRMFGGLGIYSGDIFFAIVMNDVLYLKVGEANRKDFERAGCRPLRPYGDHRKSMNYSDVPVSVLEDAGELCRWARASIAVASAPKKASSRRTRG